MPRKKGQDAGGGYRAQPRDPLNPRRRLEIRSDSLPALEVALARIRQTKGELRTGMITPREVAGVLRPAVGLNLTVREIWERYRAGVPPASERIADSVWRNHLAPWFSGCVAWDLDKAKMRAWEADLSRVRRADGKRGYSPKSKRHAWDFLRAAFRLALRDGLVSEFPWSDFRVPNPKRPERERDAPRDPRELMALLLAARACDEENGGARYPAIVTLVLTGLRQAEAAGLSWEDVNLESEPPWLHIRRQARRGWPRLEGIPLNGRSEWAPKGGKAREQSLHPNVAAVLRYQRHRLKTLGLYRENGPVFPRPGTALFRTSGRILAPDAFRDVVRRSGLPMGALHWTVHSLRHGFARLELLGYGGDLRSVAERTGHADLSILQGYLRTATRGGGNSKIPELPISMVVPALEAGPEPKMLPEAAIVEEFPKVTSEKEPDPDESWAELALRWVVGGKKGRPPDVTVAAKSAYSRGFMREKRAGADAESCRKAGARARKAALAAWGRAMKRARERASEGQGTELPSVP